MADRVMFSDILECKICMGALKEHAKLNGYSWMKLVREGYSMEEVEEFLKTHDDDMVKLVVEHAKAR
jgi:hypothetical protein